MADQLMIQDALPGVYVGSQQGPTELVGKEFKLISSALTGWTDEQTGEQFTLCVCYTLLDGLPRTFTFSPGDIVRPVHNP